jgi:hypothetical protein
MLVVNRIKVRFASTKRAQQKKNLFFAASKKDFFLLHTLFLPDFA